MSKNNKPKRKLIRKASIGGFLSDISKITQEGLENLGKLGTAGKIAEIGINLFDPTGVTGWEELGKAVTALSNEKNITNFGKFVLAAVGATPATSVAKKVQNILDGVNEGKDILKIIKGVDEVQDASKIIKAANKNQDALKVLDKGQDASTEVAKIEGSEKIFRTTGVTTTVPNSIINAVDRLRPDAMAGWLIASNLYGAIILGSVLLGIFNNVQLNNQLWHNIGIVATVLYIIQIVVMIFFFSIKKAIYSIILILISSIIINKIVKRKNN